MSETEAPPAVGEVVEHAEPARRETRAERILPALEAVLFSSTKPVKERDLAELLEAAPKAVAEACEVVFTSLPGPAEFESVALGKDGLAEGFKKGSVLFDLTTNAPASGPKTVPTPPMMAVSSASTEIQVP